MWTLLLGGNINLSIALTTISTLSAFFMMPFWIFTLGSSIFERAELGVPYARISEFAAGLLIPLAIGLLIQRFMPKTAKFLVRVLKPVSLVLILFIVIFAIITNLYIFQLFSWQVIKTLLENLKTCYKKSLILDHSCWSWTSMVWVHSRLVSIEDFPTVEQRRNCYRC